MSDLISRQEVLKLLHTLPPEEAMTKALLMQSVKQMDAAQPTVITCDGCRHVGTYDTDFPCSVCIRREKDYYVPEG